MWFKTIFILLFLIIIGSPTLAQTIVPVIGPPFGKPQAGNDLIFPVYYHNSGSRNVTVSLPDQLECRLKSGQNSITVVARRIDPENESTITLAANGFIKTRFSLLLANDTKAEVLLIVPQVSSTGILINVRPSADSKKRKDRFSWTPRSSDQPMADVLALYQPYVKNISFYNPIYFLVGTDPEDSKFQVSFKYRFFNPEKPLAKRYPWVEGFHLGYTQTSFWDLSSDSAPFEDTSYKPELFFVSPRIKTPNSFMDGLVIQTGVQHESNGKGAEHSRSTNLAYVEPNFLFYDEQKRAGFNISTRFWLYFDNEEKNNPDIEDYRGYFNLGLTLGIAESLAVDTNFQWAAKGASVQVDATYPLHALFFDHLDMYLHVNYSNTLAERMINYTEREEAFRIGLSIVR